MGIVALLEAGQNEPVQRHATVTPNTWRRVRATLRAHRIRSEPEGARGRSPRNQSRQTQANSLPHLVRKWRRQRPKSPRTSPPDGDGCGRLFALTQFAASPKGGPGAKPPKPKPSDSSEQSPAPRPKVATPTSKITSDVATRRRRVRATLRAHRIRSEPEGGPGAKPPKQIRSGVTFHPIKRTRSVRFSAQTVTISTFLNKCTRAMSSSKMC